MLICSDRQAALGALNGYLVRSREVLRFRGLLGELARTNSASLLWVPGYSIGIGNEKDDRLANGGTRAVRVTHCSVSLPACYLNGLLGKWLGERVLKRWQKKKGSRQAKLLIEEQQSEVWLAELRKFDRRRFRLAIGWSTGY